MILKHRLAFCARSETRLQLGLCTTTPATWPVDGHLLRAKRSDDLLTVVAMRLLRREGTSSGSAASSSSSGHRTLDDIMEKAIQTMYAVGCSCKVFILLTFDGMYVCSVDSVSGGGGSIW